MSAPSAVTPSLEPAPQRPPRPRALAAWGAGILCVAGFAASYAFGRGELDTLTLVLCGAKDRELLVAQHEWWRLLTAGFLHANLLHLAINVYALSALGPLTEHLWGTRRFILIYAVALVAGSLASTVATEGVSVGASGAIFGLFGAIAVFSTVHRRFIEPGARWGLWLNLLGILAVNVILGLSIQFVDNAAHAGGFAGGALAALLLRPIPCRRGILPRGEAAGSRFYPQGALSPVREAAVRLAAALALAAIAGSLAEAVWYARSADWILLARTRLDRLPLAPGLSLLVPRDWKRSRPENRDGFYTFAQPGRAALALRVLDRGRWGTLAAIAHHIEQEMDKQGAEPVYQREIEVGDLLATDLAFRTRRGHEVQRNREVLFATALDQLVQVTCLCSERRYRLLEILFDEILQSIRVGHPPSTSRQAPATIWDRVGANPRDPEAYYQLAIHYRREGRSDAAEQALRVALGLRPRYADAHDQLAHLYATASGRLRRPDLAIRHARQALALQPNKPMYLGTLALAYEAAGRHADALAAARRAAALAPDDAHFADLVKRLEGK